MTQVWPVFGVAPVPTLTSSYWSPLGSRCIFDSLFPFSASALPFSSPAAGSATRAIAASPARRNDPVLFIGSVSFHYDRPFPLRRARRIMTDRGQGPGGGKHGSQRVPR